MIYINIGYRIKDQGSDGHLKTLETLKKKSLQRLYAAIVGAGRRVSAEVLQENANEKGEAEKQNSHW